jgi:hypothetical protein
MKLEELEQLPWREVSDYLTYLQLTTREEQMQQERAQKGVQHGGR